MKKEGRIFGWIFAAVNLIIAIEHRKRVLLCILLLAIVALFTPPIKDFILKIDKRISRTTLNVISVILVICALIGLLLGDSYPMTNTKESKRFYYSSEESFEADLNEGYDLHNVTVTFQAEKVIPDTRLGYNIWSGEHLNFYPDSKPQSLRESDYITVQVHMIKRLDTSFRVFCTILKIEEADR